MYGSEFLLNFLHLVLSLFRATKPFTKMSFSCTICHDSLSQTLVDLQLNDSDTSDCTIVAHNPPSSVEVVSAQCGHVFHNECLDKWFQSQDGAVQCPICRVVISKPNCRRLFLSSLSSDFLCKYLDMKSEVEVARNRIDKLELCLKNSQDELEVKIDELETVRSDLQRQAMEIRQLNSQNDELMVRTAIDNNWADMVEELKTENATLRTLLDKQVAPESENCTQPIVHRNLGLQTTFESDENGNLICGAPPFGKTVKTLKGETKKVSTPVATTLSGNGNCPHLFKTTLDLRSAITKSGVDKVVADLKLLVKAESQQTQSAAPMVQDVLETAIAKQVSFLQVCEFLKESVATIVRERSYLQKLRMVQHQVFPETLP